MKCSPGLIGFVLFTITLVLRLASTGNAEVAPGDRAELVFERLGQPSGSIGSDSFRILYYERGEVQIRDGVVESAELIPEEEARMRREDREARQEAHQQAMERARQQRIVEGERRLEARLNDPAFINASPQQRFAFFDLFQRTYPEIDVSFEHGVARAELEAKRREMLLREARDEERLAREIRLREAEARVARAEREALLLPSRVAVIPSRPVYFGRPIIIAPKPPVTKPRPPKKADPPPGIDAVYNRGGVNIYYRSDYINNEAHIQRVSPPTGNAAQRVDQAVRGTAAQRVDSAFRTRGNN